MNDGITEFVVGFVFLHSRSLAYFDSDSRMRKVSKSETHHHERD